MRSNHPGRKVLPLLLLAAPAVAQSPREAVEVNLGAVGNAEGLNLVSAHGRTYAMWLDIGSYDVMTSASDGRGLEWSAPTVVDSDPDTSTVRTTLTPFGEPAIAVGSGDAVYATWRDQRNGGPSARDVYFNRSLDGGATWGTDVRIDKGFPVGLNAVLNWALAVAPDPGGDPANDNVYVVTSPTAQQGGELWVAASNDGGQTFMTAFPLSGANGQADHDEFAIAAEGQTVHVVWFDERNGEDDVFYRRSVNGGCSWEPELRLDGPATASTGDAEEFVRISVVGQQVAVAWLERGGGAAGAVRQIRVAVSADGGATFSPDQPVGSAAGTANVTELVAARCGGGALCLGWIDLRSGIAEAYAATSFDAGATFLPENRLSSFSASNLRLAADPDSGLIGAKWDSPFPPVQTEISYSYSCGVAWDVPPTPPAVSVSTTPNSAFDSVMAVDGEYGNFLHTWITFFQGSRRVWAGGYRPQTAEPTGFVAGGTANFELSGWQQGQPVFCWVLGSFTPGDLILPFGDGRNLGLAPTNPLILSLNDPTTFLTTLDPLGTGATLPFPVQQMAGATLYSAAVSFTTAPLTILQISDVEEIVVQ